jgi:hypothetical protein
MTKKRNRQRQAQRLMTAQPKARAAQPQAAGIERPPAEQQQRVRFELGQVISEMGQVMGLAYRRLPLIETMGKGGKLSPDELGALRYYRTAFDRSERSPVKCCLNVSGVGGTGPSHALFHATPAMIDAKRRVRLCESVLGHSLETMREVVLSDKSFSQVAIERFGSRVIRPTPHVDKEGRARGEHREQIRPRSGKHREIIRREFADGLRELTDAVRYMITRGAVEEVWVEPEQGGPATIKRGLFAPAGRYRCWGDWAMIDKIMKILRDKHGDGLVFRSAVDALAALKDAEDGRLRHLEDDELAA